MKEKRYPHRMIASKKHCEDKSNIRKERFTSNRGLISNIYKELKKLDFRETSKPIKK